MAVESQTIPNRTSAGGIPPGDPGGTPWAGPTGNPRYVIIVIMMMIMIIVRSNEIMVMSDHSIRGIYISRSPVRLKPPLGPQKPENRHYGDLRLKIIGKYTFLFGYIRVECAKSGELNTFSEDFRVFGIRYVERLQ